MDVTTVIRYIEGLSGYPLNPDEGMHHGEPGTSVPGIAVCCLASPLDVYFFHDDCTWEILSPPIDPDQDSSHVCLKLLRQFGDRIDLKTWA